jgi:hypothetical protein
MKQLADLTAPAKPVRKLLEKDIQKQCVDWARARGYWARKFSSQSQRSVPDYLFAKRLSDVWSTQVYFATEFKAPGKSSTEAQVEEQKAMLLAGWYVFESDNFEKFKREVTIIEALYA